MRFEWTLRYLNKFLKRWYAFSKEDVRQYFIIVAILASRCHLQTVRLCNREMKLRYCSLHAIVATRNYGVSTSVIAADSPSFERCHVTYATLPALFLHDIKRRRRNYCYRRGYDRGRTHFSSCINFRNDSCLFLHRKIIIARKQDASFHLWSD